MSGEETEQRHAFAGSIRRKKLSLYNEGERKPHIIYTATSCVTMTTYHVNEVADSEDICKEFPDALAAQDLIRDLQYH